MPPVSDVTRSRASNPIAGADGRASERSEPTARPLAAERPGPAREREVVSGPGPAAADPADVAARHARFMVVGRTLGGQVFRPSDWAERLCGVMAQYRPGGRSGQRYLGYSPYVVPTRFDGVSSVVVDARLRDIEPMALNFVVGFARDNGLQVHPLD